MAANSLEGEKAFEKLIGEISKAEAEESQRLNQLALFCHQNGITCSLNANKSDVEKVQPEYIEILRKTLNELGFDNIDLTENRIFLPSLKKAVHPVPDSYFTLDGNQLTAQGLMAQRLASKPVVFISEKRLKGDDSLKEHLHEQLGL